MLENVEYYNGNYKKYNLNDITHLKLRNEDIVLLTTLGLPIIKTNYHTFSPVQKLAEMDIEGKKYVLLGYPFKSYNSQQKSLMVLDILTNEIMLYDRKLFEMGYSKSLFWTVNKSLMLFLYFQQIMINTINIIFLPTSTISFKEAEYEYKNMLNKFTLHDCLSLKREDYSIESYWRKCIFHLQLEIEEKYDSFID